MYPQVTRRTLLERVKAGENCAWSEFYETYRSLVWLKGKDYNLTDAEQQDLLSDVMSAFFNAQGKFIYDPKIGQFRYYFRKLIASCCIKIIKKRLPNSIDDGNGESQEPPAPTNDEDDFEWKAFLLHLAIEEVTETMDTRQVQCFLRCKKNGESPVKVASDMQISLATAYNYCNAVMNSVKAIVVRLEKEYA